MSCCFLIWNQSYAQLTISGKIKEFGTGINLPGVTVYLEDLRIGTITDLNGYYKIDNLKPGSYVLMVDFVGYKSNSLKLNLTKDTLINFEMTPGVTELNEVVVTGVSRAKERKLSPIAIETINQDLLRQNVSSNLIDGLKTIPGISQITTGASISKPVIRGVGYNRVLVLNDGIRQEGQQWGSEHGIEIDEYAIDRVEIIKGPGSLIYGSDGIAGVINFLPPKSLPNGEHFTQILTNYQSNNGLIGHSISQSGAKKDWQWLGQWSNKFAGDYQNKRDGKVYNSGFREYDAKLFGGVNKNWGHTYFTARTFNTQVGIVEGERDSLGNFAFENSAGDMQSAEPKDLKGYGIGIPRQRINHLSLATNNYFIMKRGKLKAAIGFQQNRRREYEDPTSPNEVGLYLRLNTWTYNARFELHRIRGWEMTYGLSGMQQNNKNKGEEFLIPNYKLFDFGGYFYVQKTLAKWTFEGGFRGDVRHLNTQKLILDEDGLPTTILDLNSTLKFEPIHKNFTGFSGSIGLSYQMSVSSTFKINLSRGYRAPNLAELSSNGVHEGTFRYEIGNTKLRPENSNQLDVGYYLDSKHVTFELTPFVNKINHYIFLQRKAVGDSLEHPLENELYEYASGNALLFGGEVYLDFHPHPLDWLHIANSFSIVRGIQRGQADSMRYLPSIPAPKYRLEAKTVFKKMGNSLSNSFILFALDYYFRQDKIFTAFETETPTPHYALLSLGLGTEVNAHKKKKFLSIYFNIDNLLNKTYQNHLSRLKYAPINIRTGSRGVYNMGRNVSLKLIFKL